MKGPMCFGLPGFPIGASVKWEYVWNRYGGEFIRMTAGGYVVQQSPDIWIQFAYRYIREGRAEVAAEILKGIRDLRITNREFGTI